MLEDACAHAHHLAPPTGGSCPCGMVTFVPADRSPALGEPAVRDLIARCLVERGGVPDLASLRGRADKVLGALAAAGLVVAPRPVGVAAQRRSA